MSDTVKIKGREFKKYITSSEINLFIEEIAEQLNTTYKNRNPILISVLDGSFMFTADLIRKLKFEHELVFVKMESYVGLKSSGNVKIVLPLFKDVTGRDVLIIEDIVDTGLTLDRFIEVLKNEDPNDVAVCSLLLKPKALQYDLPLKFIGAKIPNDFVIGYGMDYDGEGRNLPEIYVNRPS